MDSIGLNCKTSDDQCNEFFGSSFVRQVQRKALWVPLIAESNVSGGFQICRSANYLVAFELKRKVSVLRFYASIRLCLLKMKTRWRGDKLSSESTSRKRVAARGKSVLLYDNFIFIADKKKFKAPLLTFYISFSRPPSLNPPWDIICNHNYYDLR